MVKFLKAKSCSFESGKLAVKKSQLLGSQKIDSLSHLSFDEILKFLEEHGFREQVDKSYLSYEGFYLVERVLNSHLSQEYSDVFSSANTSLKNFLTLYYLKYQIHNFMVVVRCFKTQEEDIKPYLIGEKSKQTKFLKSFSMPNLEDAMVYLAKKLSFDETRVLEEHKKGVYFLENYLYKQYYQRLFSTRISYNHVLEKKFVSHLRESIDALNARTYLRLKFQAMGELKFEESFLTSGNKDLSYFESCDSLSLEDTFEKFRKDFSLSRDCETQKCLVEFDKLVSSQKSKLQKLLSQANFGSPFFVMKYFLDLESEMAELRVLLKSRYLGLEQKDLEEL